MILEKRLDWPDVVLIMRARIRGWKSVNQHAMLTFQVHRARYEETIRVNIHAEHQK